MTIIEELFQADKRYKQLLRQCLDGAPELFIGARKELGLSQRALAELLECDHTYISKIENGHQQPGKPVLYKLGELINLRETGRTE